MFSEGEYQNEIFFALRNNGAEAMYSEFLMQYSRMALKLAHIRYKLYPAVQLPLVFHEAGSFVKPIC